MFRSTGKASLRSLEERWEVRLREYLAGKGVPMMAAWVAQPTNIDMNSDSARSITLLRAASASTLMPLNEGWGLEVSNNALLLIFHILMLSSLSLRMKCRSLKLNGT